MKWIWMYRGMSDAQAIAEISDELVKIALKRR
jgi:hypothetical protein